MTKIDNSLQEYYMYLIEDSLMTKVEYIHNDTEYDTIQNALLKECKNVWESVSAADVPETLARYDKDKIRAYHILMMLREPELVVEEYIKNVIRNKQESLIDELSAEFNSSKEEILENVTYREELESMCKDFGSYIKGGELIVLEVDEETLIDRLNSVEELPINGELPEEVEGYTKDYKDYIRTYFRRYIDINTLDIFVRKLEWNVQRLLIRMLNDMSLRVVLNLDPIIKGEIIWYNNDEFKLDKLTKDEANYG